MPTLDRIVDIVKNVTELNLRYTSTLLYLGKDYVKDINTVVTTSTAPSRPGGETAPAGKPQPLLIAGRRDETVGAAFPLANSSGRDVNVTLVAQGELDDAHVKLDPQSVVLKNGESAIVRVIVRIDSKLEVGRDYAGAVGAPGLSAQFVDFIVRRLPDVAAADPAPAAPAATARRRAAPAEGSTQ